MTDNELLLAISDSFDKKLKAEMQPIRNDLQDLKNHVNNIKLFQENVILPRLNTIESCYTDTYKRYKSGTEEIEAMKSDVNVIKSVIKEHSDKLQKIS